MIIAHLLVYSLSMLQARKTLSMLSLVPKGRRSGEVLWAAEAANAVLNHWALVPRTFETAPDTLSRIGLLMPLDVTRQRLTIAWLRAGKFFHSAQSLQKLLAAALSGLSTTQPGPDNESDQETSDPLKKFFTSISPLPASLSSVGALLGIVESAVLGDYLRSWGLVVRDDREVVPPVRKVRNKFCCFRAKLAEIYP